MTENVNIASSTNGNFSSYRSKYIGNSPTLLVRSEINQEYSIIFRKPRHFFLVIIGFLFGYGKMIFHSSFFLCLLDSNLNAEP